MKNWKTFEEKYWSQSLNLQEFGWKRNGKVWGFSQCVHRMLIGLSGAQFQRKKVCKFIKCLNNLDDSIVKIHDEISTRLKYGRFMSFFLFFFFLSHSPGWNNLSENHYCQLNFQMKMNCNHSLFFGRIHFNWSESFCVRGF